MKAMAQPEDEQRLLARCRAGDTRAFQVLVERYRDRAYGLALRVLRSEPDAEEVAQDSFVRAWKALADFRGDAAFGTWLYRIVWRRALDRAAVLRQRHGREAPLEGGAGEPVAVSGFGGFELGAQPGSPREPGGRAAGLSWERLTEGLSEPQRAVVTLFYYEDMSVKDVARALEVPEGTVKTHLSRARAALRARYREAGGHDDAV
jgi:RNA polymerase sigma-70 factor (ECF subfamily)